MMKQKSVLTKMFAIMMAVIMVALTPLSYDLGFADYLDQVQAEEGYEYETYDVLTNADWQVLNGSNQYENDMPASWDMINDKVIRFTPSAENTSGSFVWKFDYTCTTKTGAANIYPLSSGSWNGAAPFDFNGIPGFEAGQTYPMELGVVKIKNQSTYHVFLKIDGVICYEKAEAESAKKGNDLYFYLTTTGAAGTCATPAEEPTTYEYEVYDELTNEDWQVLNGSNVYENDMPASWDMINDKVIRFTPSAENTTGSFVWKFNYTVTTKTGAANIYPLSSGSWNGSDPFDFNGIPGFEVGQTYPMEFGVVKIKNSSNYHIFLKVDGVQRYERIDAESKRKGNDLYFYLTTTGAAGTCVAPVKEPDPEPQYDYEFYDKLTNADWKVLNGSNVYLNDMPESWSMVDDKVIRFEPSAQNTTGSFVWKFIYTCTTKTDAANIYPLSQGAWNGSDPFDFNGISGFEVGKTYEMELGVVKIQNSTDYHIFLKVDGVLKFERMDAESKRKGNDLYFYLTGASAGGAGTCTSIYETYDVLENSDFRLDGPNGVKMPNDWMMMDNVFIDFAPSANNATGSFVWKFDYTCVSQTGAVNIYPRAAGEWGGDGNTVFDFNGLGFVEGTTYKMEVGVLKLRNSNAYHVYVKADGAWKYEKEITDGVEKGHGLYFYLTDKAAKDGAGFCSFEEPYMTYDLLYNSDWTVYNGSNIEQGVMQDGWTMSSDQFINFTPSESNATASFIWKYRYTHTENAQARMLVYPFACRPWGSSVVIDYNACGFVQNETYDVEFGVVRLKNSAENEYQIFVKVNGEYKIQETLTRTVSGGGCQCTDKENDVTKHTGMYLYFENGGKGTCTQTAYHVTVDGKLLEVDKNGTLGSALVTFNGPKGYTLIGWKDQNGNAVARDTVITSDMTVTPMFATEYSIVDVDGNPLTSGSHIYGEKASYNAAAELTKDKITFIGFQVGEKLYKDLANAIDAGAAASSAITAKTITLGSVDGAGIRLKDNLSIRFIAGIGIEDSKQVTVKDYGMILTTESVLSRVTDFTFEGLEAAGIDAKYYSNIHKNTERFKAVEHKDYPGELTYSVVFDTMSFANSATKYAARAYAQVEYADGTTGYVYSEFDPAANVRSMYQVACAAIADTGAGYSDANKAAIQKYIDAIVDLNSGMELQGPSRNYTIEVTGPVDGKYAVKVNPLNGFDLKNLGAVYVAGQRIAILSADLTEQTFWISSDKCLDAAAGNVFDTLDVATADRELLINAYCGPQLGVRVEGTKAAPSEVYGGKMLTLADLETYMNAGFNSWRIEVSVLTDVVPGYEAKGTVLPGETKAYDIYQALDLAAEYAQKYGKACPVYVTFPHLANMDNTDGGKTMIQACYNIFTGYDDGITGRNGVPAPVDGKKNQIAGFLLHDEPTMSDYDNFAAVYNYIAYDLGAIEAGYGFSFALLQTYATEANLGGTYEAYVQKYATLLKDTTIAFDNYPFNYQNKSGFLGIGATEEWTLGTDWFYDMQVIRSQSNGYGTCIQSYTAGPLESGSWSTTTKYKTIKSASEISMQMYTALAYGFTDFDYFTYMEPNNFIMQKNSGVVSEVFQETPVMWNDYSDWSKGYTTTEMYNWIQTANSEATKLYDVLGKFTNNGVQLVAGSTSNNYFGNAKTTNETNAVTVTSTYDLVVGGFKCGDLNGYLATNVDLPNNGDRTTTATFTLGTEYACAIVYVDGVATMKPITNGTLTLDIAAGEGVFIIPVEK